MVKKNPSCFLQKDSTEGTLAAAVHGPRSPILVHIPQYKRICRLQKGSIVGILHSFESSNATGRATRTGGNLDPDHFDG